MWGPWAGIFVGAPPSLSKQRLLLQNDGPTEKATYRWLVTCPLNEKEKIIEIELYLI